MAHTAEQVAGGGGAEQGANAASTSAAPGLVVAQPSSTSVATARDDGFVGRDADAGATAERAGAPLAQAPGGRPAESSSILKLKGLPYSTTEASILEFFKDFSLVSVRFVFEPDGRPSGLAFAEFQDKDEAIRALSKNGEFIGERYVRLLHVPVTEMEEQVRLGTLAIPGNAAKLRSRLLRQQQQQRNRMAFLGPLQLMPAMVPSARGGQLMNMNMGLALNHQQGVGGQLQLESRSWPPSYGQAPQASPSMQLAAQFQNLSMAGGGLNMSQNHMMHQQHQHQLQQQQQQQQQNSSPLMSNLLQPTAAQILHPAHAANNPASATLKVRGLPYRSSPAEILSFFQGYQYLPDSLQIGLDSLGRPSGEAWLTFVNPPEALRAVRDLNRHYLGNRYLELSIC